MKKLHLLTLALIGSLILAACSSTPAPAPKPYAILVTPAMCELLRVTRDNGTYSPAFGGAGGTFVPENGLNLAIPLYQLECRRDGVFKPFKG